jgi:hypothetical protein
VCLLISNLAWSSKPLTKTDFAYGIDVTLGEHQLYEFTVNEAIYNSLQYDDIRDVRIFDASGVIVPVKIFNVFPDKYSEVVHTQNKESLTFFPISENLQKPLQDLNIYVKRNDAGTIVNINSSPTAGLQQTNTYYIVDMGERDNVELNALEILWDGDKTPKSMVTVQTSDDLTHWQSSGEGAVFQLRHNEQVLSHNMVPIFGLKRYLKIQLDHAALLGINSVINKTAMINVASAIGQATLHKQTPTQFYYHILGKYPVHSLHIFPQQDDAIYTIQLISGTQADVQNHTHFRGSIYKLNSGNQSFTTDPVPLAGRRDSYWRIDVVESNQANITPPTFEFAYYPHHIRFLSNQAGQYTIAFGSALVKNFSPAIPPEIDQHESRAQILDLSTAHAISGDGKLIPLQPPKNYQKLVLWAVLAVVLLIMGFMVVRLLKHMREVDS